MATATSTAIVYPPILLPWAVAAATFGADDSGADSGADAETDTDTDSGTDASPTTADEYYGQYAGAVLVADHTGGGTDITVDRSDFPDDATPISVYTINGGAVSFYSSASGKKLPNQETVTVDTLVVEITPSEYQTLKSTFPSGALVPKLWAYEGMDVDTFKNQLTRWATAVPAAEAARFKAAFPPPSADVDDETNYYNRVLEGNWASIVPAGTYLGWIFDSGSGACTLRVRAFDMAGDEIESVAPVLATLDEVDSKLAGHPVIDGAAAVPHSTEVHLRFRYFKPSATGSATKGTWEWLTGATVEIIDADLEPVNPDDVLATGTTSSVAGKEGTIDFTIPAPGFESNDFYFRVTPAAAIQRQYGLTTADIGSDAEWTGSWSTEGWNDINGLPGYYEDFSGASLGRPSTPLTFNVGVPIFLKLEYYNKNDSKYRHVGKGTEVAIYRDQTTAETAAYMGGDDNPYYTIADNFYADADGEVWGTTFDMYAGYRFGVTYTMAIKDVSISLPETRVISTDVWKSWDDAANGVYYETGFSGPAVGDAASAKLAPVRLSSSYEAHAAAMYVLKTIRDIHQFVWYMTGRSFTGVTGVSVTLEPGTGTCNTSETSITFYHEHWYTPRVIAHEFGHAIMLSRFSALAEGLTILIQQHHFGTHYADQSSNVAQAFIEGWAEFVSIFFGESIAITDTDADGLLDVGDDSYTTRIPLFSISKLGQTVEGAFALAFSNYLIAQGAAVFTLDDSADLATKNAWLTTASIQSAFQQLLWTPLNTLADTDVWTDATTMNMADLLTQVAASMGAASYSAFSTGYLATYNLV